MAISEAVEDAATRDDTKYSLGVRAQPRAARTRPSSGQRRSSQMEMAGEEPDVVIACTGGGSNFAGLVVPVRGPEASRRG